MYVLDFQWQRQNSLRIWPVIQVVDHCTFVSYFELYKYQNMLLIKALDPVGGFVWVSWSITKIKKCVMWIYNIKFYTFKNICKRKFLFFQHYICWSDIPVPRISVIFSLEELKEIERDCAVYVGRMERIARYSSISKEEKVN